MPQSRPIQGGPGRKAAPLLASCLTLMYGVIGCSFAITFYSKTPELHLLIVMGVSLTLAVLLWLTHRAVPQAALDISAYSLGRGREDPLAGYAAVPKGKRPARYGDRRPVTADEVRDIQANVNANVFVPGRGGR